MERLKGLFEMFTGCTSVVQTANAYAHLDRKMRTLERRLETLVSREADVNQTLEHEESLLGKIRKREVENWLENVGRLKLDVGKMEREFAEGRVLSRLRIVSCVDELASEVDRFYEQGKFAEGLSLDAEVERVGASTQMPLNKLLGRFFQVNLSKIWDCLMDRALQQKFLTAVLVLIYSEHSRRQMWSRH
ncbi:hypothetical protein ACJRO7_031954 [Eucalyptus globulus]|uniref:Uncharacterized protein n=1 Tax=Eucalyptus globulus TaxID=34317 RepID=A0ABD3JMR7_EUCGL